MDYELKKGGYRILNEIRIERYMPESKIITWRIDLKRLLLLTAIILAIASFVSCSGASEFVTLPGSPDPVVKETANAMPGTTMCLGFYQVTYDKASGNVDVTVPRNADKIVNVLGFLEPPALIGLSIDFDTIVFNDPVLEVDVILKHPIPDPVFMGFDVRGVVFGPKVANADGLTIIPSPEYFTGVQFGYHDGMLGSPDSFANYEGLAGYKYFCDDLSLNEDLAEFMSNPADYANRGVFSDGSTLSRHYVLDWGNVEYSFMIFNYAIYANYDWPVGDPPIDLNNFGISIANSAEAFCADITEVSNSLWFYGSSGGGGISLQVEVWDWQGEPVDVTLEAGSVIAHTGYTSSGYNLNGGEFTTYVYDFVGVAGTPTEAGDLDIIITVTDEVTFGEAWFLSLLGPGHVLYNDPVYNCFVHTAEVIESPMPEVTGIVPGCGSSGDTLIGVKVKGLGFIDGASLGVTLRKASETDIVATNVSFVSAAEITCDIQIPSSAGAGAWDVVVTHGSGTDLTGTELFTIIDCGTMTSPTRHYSVITSGNMCISTFAGTCATQTGTPYAITNFRDISTQYYNRLWAKLVSQNGGGEQFSSDGVGVGRIDRDMVCDSQNNVYFTDSTDYNRLRYFPFDASTGFGSLVDFGTLDSGWRIWRITIDENDNPVVLAFYNANMSVFHWNGSSWDTTAVPTSVSGGSYRNISDFDYNPLQDHYVFVRNVSGPANLYAVDTDGDLVTMVSDLFNGNYFDYQVGIYIDVLDPDCRIICWGSFSFYTENNTPMARLNAAYGGKVVSMTDSDNYQYGALNSSRGQWAKGSNELITGCHYINVYAKIHLPTDW